MFLETGDAAKSQGWTALVLDTNGNGKRDAYVEPRTSRPTRRRTRASIRRFYAVMPSPADGSIWGSTLGVPGAVVRLAPGSNPPETALAEIYRVPLPGFGARGADIDSKGVVWVSLGSGHIGSFDRRKCKGPLNGPKATGDHCPEGWTFHQYPGPGFKGIGENSAESSYYTWVDQHNTFGLGNDVPMSTGNLNDGLDRVRQRPDGRAARAVSDRLLREGLRRPHRRSEGGLEGTRALGGQRRPHAVAHRGRQGHETARGALPVAAGSAGEVAQPACAHNCARLVHIRALEDSPALNEVEQHDDDGDHQQDVNYAAHGVAAHQPDQPEDHEHDGDLVQHHKSPFKQPALRATGDSPACRHTRTLRSRWSKRRARSTHAKGSKRTDGSYSEREGYSPPVREGSTWPTSWAILDRTFWEGDRRSRADRFLDELVELSATVAWTL